MELVSQDAAYIVFLFMTFIHEQFRINRLTLATARDFGYRGNAVQQTNIEENQNSKVYIANVGATQFVNQNDMQQLVTKKNMQANQIIQL